MSASSDSCHPACEPVLHVGVFRQLPSSMRAGIARFALKCRKRLYIWCLRIRTWNDMTPSSNQNLVYNEYRFGCKLYFRSSILSTLQISCKIRQHLGIYAVVKETMALYFVSYLRQTWTEFYDIWCVISQMDSHPKVQNYKIILSGFCSAAFWKWTMKMCIEPNTNRGF